MLIKISNLTMFIFYAIIYNTPLHLWPRAWREIQADHLAETRKMVWELKCQGLVREGKDGYLYPKNKFN